MFSKYLHSVLLRTKTGKEVAAALEPIFKDPKYTKPICRRPVWVRTDKGKEFLNTPFQALLKREGIEFQVCRNPDVECAVVERVNRTLRDKLHRHFTYKNTYHYLDVLPKFIKGYNARVHSSTGMAPADVRDTDVLTIWNKMRGKAAQTRRLSNPNFRVRQHVRISKEKMKFAKGGEQNYITQIFKIRKVVYRTPAPCSNSRTCAAKRSKASFTAKSWFPFASRNRPPIR